MAVNDLEVILNSNSQGMMPECAQQRAGETPSPKEMHPRSCLYFLKFTTKIFPYAPNHTINALQQCGL